MVLLLPDLLPLAGFLVAAGIVFVLWKFTRALGGALTIMGFHVPFIGDAIGGTAKTVFKWIDGEFAAAYAALEGQVGNSFHKLARLTENIGRQIEHNATAVQVLTTALLGQTLGGTLATLVHRLTRQQSHTQVQVKQATVKAHSAAKSASQAASAAQVRTQGHKITANTKAIEHVVGHAVPIAVPGAIPIPAGHTGELPNIRAKLREAEQAASRAWDWIKTHRGSVITGVATGVVGLALGKLGAGWTRCSNWNRYGKAICRADSSLIDNLLGDALAIVGTVSLVEFIREAQAVETEAVDALRFFIRE